MTAYPQSPTFPIDVRKGRRTSVSRSGPMGISIDVDDASMDNAALAPMPARTYKANLAGSSAQPTDVGPDSVSADLTQRVRPSMFTGADLNAKLAAAAASGFIIDLGIDGFAGITSFPGSAGRRVEWAHGFYSQGGQPDPMPQSAFAPAVAFDGSAGGRYAYAIRNGQVTGNDVYNKAFPNVSNFDLHQAVLDIAPGTGCHNLAAIAGYVRNRSATNGTALGSANGVALFGVAAAEVDGSAVWGANTLITDNYGRIAGAGARTLTGYENDINITQSNSTVIGFSVGGNGLRQPASATAYITNSLGTVDEAGVTAITWDNAFWSLDGVAKRGLVLGALKTSGANVKGQPIWLQAFDATGTKKTGVIQQDGAYVTFADISQASWPGVKIQLGNLALDGGQGVIVNGNTVLSDRRTGWVAGTGAANRGAFNADYLQTFSASYQQAEANALASVVKQIAQRVLAIETDLRAHGMING